MGSIVFPSDQSLLRLSLTCSLSLTLSLGVFPFIFTKSGFKIFFSVYNFDLTNHIFDTRNVVALPLAIKVLRNLFVLDWLLYFMHFIFISIFDGLKCIVAVSPIYETSFVFGLMNFLGLINFFEKVPKPLISILFPSSHNHNICL